MSLNIKVPIYHINLVDIKRSSGYGQYTIVITILLEGKEHTIKVHSTNSELYDNATDCYTYEDRTNYLLTQAKHTITSAISDYISSL